LGQLVFTKTHVREILDQARCRLEVGLEELMLIDSLEMGPRDRAKIAKRCRKSLEDRLVITHGTDTMVKTAGLLGRFALEKTIVLVGAMVPYSFGRSDALFNLGCAFSAVQLLPYGVYVTMNGRVFDWDDVFKDRARGDFERLGQTRWVEKES
jgi:L-asparaginase